MQNAKKCEGKLKEDIRYPYEGEEVATTRATTNKHNKKYTVPLSIESCLKIRHLVVSRTTTILPTT